MTLHEICTQEIPVRGRMRAIQIPEEAPQEVADLIWNCLSPEPAERPTAKEICGLLAKLQ